MRSCFVLEFFHVALNSLRTGRRSWQHGGSIDVTHLSIWCSSWFFLARCYAQAYQRNLLMDCISDNQKPQRRVLSHGAVQVRHRRRCRVSRPRCAPGRHAAPCHNAHQHSSAPPGWHPPARVFLQPRLRPRGEMCTWRRHVLNLSHRRPPADL